MCDFDMNMDGMMPLENEIYITSSDDTTDVLGSSSHSPFSSGFDNEYPIPGYEELRNAGFSDYLAHNISESGCHSYSDSELYHVLYESDDPVSAYNDMMGSKAQHVIDEADALIKNIENSGLLGTSSEDIDIPDVDS